MDAATTRIAIETPKGESPVLPDNVTVNDNGQVVPPELQPQGGEKLFAGKYKSVEELEKGYAELSKKLGAQKKSETPTIETPPAKTEEQNADQKQADGLDLNAISEEYAKNGSLSEEQYAALAKAGHSRDVVDNYIRGQEAVAKELRSELAASVGGEEQMGKVLKWAGENLSPEEVSAYNEALKTRNPKLAKLALQGVAAEYAKAFPAAPTRVNGQTASGGNSGVKPFANQTEMMKAISDPKYSMDTTYRRSVEQRIMVSVFD